MIPFVALVQSETTPDPASLGSLGLRSFLALAVVGALLAAAVWALRRVNDTRRGKQVLSVESALPLGDKRSLVIVAVEGRRLLIGVAPNGVSLVTELHATFNDTLDRTMASSSSQPS
jgi:flagellar biosynthetic protein FliO